MKRLVLSTLLALASAFRPALAQTPPNDSPAKSRHWTLTSSVLRRGGKLPIQFTCGDGGSPPLAWSKPPAGTQSLALVLERVPSHGAAKVYWILYNLPPDLRRIYGSVAPTAVTVDLLRQCSNDFGLPGYQGPCGAMDKGKYRFRIYALNCSLKLRGGGDPGIFRRAILGHRLDKADFTVVYVP